MLQKEEIINTEFEYVYILKLKIIYYPFQDFQPDLTTFTQVTFCFFVKQPNEPQKQ